MNIILIGFMGTGKSAIGKILADKLKWSFYDTDDMIEKQVGYSIADIFAKSGESSFREMECHAVRLVGLMDKAVVSTGGGVPLREDNMKELSRQGRVFCLTAKPETILYRLRNEIKTRPLLKVKNPGQKIEELLHARQKAYSRCHHTVVTDDKDPHDIAEEILNLFNQKQV